jgi:hypothetical protein
MVTQYMKLLSPDARCFCYLQQRMTDCKDKSGQNVSHYIELENQRASR